MLPLSIDEVNAGFSVAVAKGFVDGNAARTDRASAVKGDPL
jgi:hypothetical protein